MEALFTTASPAETGRLAGTLGRILRGDETIHLRGGLGSGKTCFVRGLAVGLNVKNAAAAASPSFTLINEYLGEKSLFHVDLYRLDRSVEIERLGLEEYFGRGVTAIEWAEKLPRQLTEHDLEIRFEIASEHQRRILLTAANEHSARLIREVTRAVTRGGN